MTKEVDIRKGDRQADLEERIHQTEHKIITEATGKVLADLEAKRRSER
jgi:folate-dependent phosphoribosylglycinamide formyltransferase PurN